MRYRSRSDVSSVTESFLTIHDNQGEAAGHGNFVPAGIHVWHQDVQTKVKSTSEQMWDVSSTGSGHDHPCTHIKTGSYEVKDLTSQRVLALSGFEDNGAGPKEIKVFVQQFCTGCPGRSSDPLPLLPPDVVSLVDYRSVVNEHLGRVLVPISTTVQLGNFLLELDDARRIYDNIRNVVNTRPGDQVLGYQFGVRPFIGDILSMGKALGNLQKELAWLRSAGGKPVRIVTQRSVDVDGAFEEAETNLGGETPYGVQYTSQLMPPVAIVKCVSWVTYPEDIIDSALFGIAAGLKALGLTNPAKIAWNYIRYSFVADWLFNVGSILDQLDLLQALSSPYKVDRETTHISVSRSCIYRVYSHVNVLGQEEAQFKGETCSKQTDSVYVRTVGILTGGLNFSDPSIREQGLSLLLADQLVRGRILAALRNVRFRTSDYFNGKGWVTAWGGKRRLKKWHQFTH
jgi:hypothetical protein